MRSKMFEFTDNEILEIRLVNREISFYNTLLEATEKLENNYGRELLNFAANILQKVNKLALLEDYRQEIMTIKMVRRYM